MFCTLVWFFLLVEILSLQRIALFDVGAAVLLFLSVLVLPVLAVRIWWARSDMAPGPDRRAILACAYAFIIITLIPGAMMVLFYAVAMHGEAWLD